MKRTAPAVIFAAAGGLAAAWLCAAVLISVNQPWLGLTLQARDGAVHIDHVDPEGPAAMVETGEILAGIGDEAGESIALMPGDLIEEPDQIATYAGLEEFLVRQSAISGFLRQGAVRLSVVLPQGGGYEVEPYATNRPLGSLPLMFWVGLVVSITGFMISAWVWSLRPRALEARLFALSGLGLLLTTPTFIVYAWRELALDGALFRVLMSVNFAGALTFGAALAILFLVYPRRLLPGWALALLVGLCGLSWLGDAARFGFPGPAIGRHATLGVLALIIVSAGAIQAVTTRDDPRMRASVLLFASSVAAGTGMFVLLVILPALVGFGGPASQSVVIIPFFLIYAGAAVAIARYRLFALGPWAFQILFYMGGVFVLVLLDALLVFGLALDRAPALGIALIATAFVYLPLRDVLARRLLRRREADTEAALQDVTDVALAPSGADRNALWQGVLRRAFAPLHLTRLETPVGAPRIVDDGLALHLPGTRDVAAVALSHAHGGRRLFSPRDLALAGQLCTMLRHITESRLAYDEGANTERLRIARDMHDNIGAQLLSALHSAVPERKDAMVREALSDLRLFINNAGTGGQPLVQTLAGLRLEASERLSAAGIRLDWSAPETPAPVMLAAGVIHAVRSILREAVSNAIRHSGASAMRIAIACEGDQLRVSVSDDGSGLPHEDFSEGNGFGNIRTRLAGLDGSLTIGDAEPGLRLEIEFPLPGRNPA